MGIGWRDIHIPTERGIPGDCVCDYIKFGDSQETYESNKAEVNWLLV